MVPWLRTFAATLTLVAGCSFILVRTPNPRPPPMLAECTSNRIPPILDTAIAAVFTISAVYWATARDDAYAGFGVVANTPFALGFGASAIYGWLRTNRCRAMLDRRVEQSPQ